MSGTIKSLIANNVDHYWLYVLYYFSMGMNDQFFVGDPYDVHVHVRKNLATISDSCIQSYMTGSTVKSKWDKFVSNGHNFYKNDTDYLNWGLDQGCFGLWDTRVLQ